ncbi:carbohydrate-binding protein SusD [Niastella yeongjuensis]|uniref:Carbohydrate-binding protein SusD n=1 Tax=Niastella yeongjuensis TaxID=354355 RepID=A0A1V9ENE4_9BACT|nr:RagB/SusD family nutrient uptake outer membrane protein [Niastella yeongjuensis]OQP47385.1 carbohydrate-binding protein SusD [Niastella yeongjuensis]SEN81647.1 Starch-binding associating with outer membrane [Niastella yeongjuensis]
MKKHTRLYQLMAVTTIVTIIAFTNSCKKYTEVEPESGYTVPEVFTDIPNATMAVIGIYDDLQGDNGYGIRISMYYPYDSDEGIVSGNIDNGRRGIGRYQLSLTNTEISNPFRQLYRGLERANLCIEQIPQMKLYSEGTDAEKKELRRLYAESLTLRAQYLFELIRIWGDVPAPMIPSYQQTDLYLPRNDRDSTYDKILDDLAAAIDLLPWRTEVTRNERITKGAAKALRARIALFRGGYSLRSNGKMERRDDYLKYYQITKKECEELMARPDQHTLNPNFENIWRNVTSFTPDPQGEILFEIGAGGGNGNSDSRMGNYDGPNLSNNSRYGAGGGGIIMLPNYFYAFDSVDTRRDVTITWYGVAAANNVKALRRLNELNTGKYRRDWRVPLLPGTALNVGYNWVVIRFSDVLLMYAEADNEINGGPSAAAIKALEDVRKRAYRGNVGSIGTTPTDKTGFFNAVANERYLEFGHEGIRKYDLLRWNLLSAKLIEARAKIEQIRTGTGPYTYVPDSVYWKNNGEEIQIYGGTNPAANAQPFWRPKQTPPAGSGYTALAWRANLSQNIIDSKPIGAGVGYLFVAGKSELFPFDQATIDSYQGRLVQNPNY